MASSTFRRCCRRVRKHVLRLTSPKFWNAVLHNRCHAWFGGLARKSVILLYAFYEILACAAIGYWFYKFRDAAKLSLVPMMTDYKFFSLAMFARFCFGCVGVAAACRRKIRTMRFYFFTLPASVLCAGIVAGPFVNMRCACVNYEQCRMTISHKPRELLNRFPDPFYDRQSFAHPPKIKAPKPKTDKLADAISSAPVSQHRRMAHPEFLELYPVQAADNSSLLNRSARRAARRRRLSLFSILRRRLASKSEDEKLPGGQTISSLRSHKCTCMDRIRTKSGKGQGHDRVSCKYWWKHPGQISSWCNIDPNSVKACIAAKVQLHEVDDPDIDNVGMGPRYWSEDLCIHYKKRLNGGGCDCSKIAMETSGEFDITNQVNPKFQVPSGENATLGSKCEKWRENDERKWCFVGFDSNCSDKEEYPITVDALVRLGFEVHQLEQVSQFLSSIPCSNDLMEEAMSWCRLWRNTFCFILLPLTFGPVPMAVIIYLFLRNRCGDLATFRAQFNVNLSSSSSEDDFDIPDEARSPQNSKKKKRKSKVQRDSVVSFDARVASSAPGGASSNDLRISQATRGGKSVRSNPKSFDWATSQTTVDDSSSGSEDEDGRRKKGRKMKRDTDEGLELAEVARSSRRHDDEVDDD